MSVIHFDIAVVGGGIAGLSVAAELAGSRNVAVLERESQPGYHSTGRSAALFFETYGSDLVRALTRASRPFYENPPTGFAQHVLLESCGALFVARDDQLASLESFASEEDVRKTGRVISRVEARSHCPVLREDYVSAALWDPAPASIDVSSLLEGYRRQLRERGGSLITNAEVTALSFGSGRWDVRTAMGEFTADILVNAAGAWADRIATSAGVVPIALEPRRRTAVLVRAGGTEALHTRALVIDVDEQFYFRSESGDVLVSPADETPSPPCDTQPEELDVAVAIDRLVSATTLDIRSVRAKWAGLRSFVTDRNPVLGFDQGNDRLFWLAAQGGYGIQTAPAMAQLAASVILHRPIPEIISPQIVQGLSPGRLRK
jgi:D-arginine dehydrogenase